MEFKLKVIVKFFSLPKDLMQAVGKRYKIIRVSRNTKEQFINKSTFNLIFMSDTEITNGFDGSYVNVNTEFFGHLISFKFMLCKAYLLIIGSNI